MSLISYVNLAKLTKVKSEETQITSIKHEMSDLTTDSIIIV